MHFPILPDLPSGVVPEAHVYGAGAVLVEAGYALLRRPYAHLPAAFLHYGGDVGPRDDIYPLKRGAEDGQAVVAPRPDIALAVFKYAVEFVGLGFIDLGIFRLLSIHKPKTVGSGCPKVPAAVCK